MLLLCSKDTLSSVVRAGRRIFVSRAQQGLSTISAAAFSDLLLRLSSSAPAALTDHRAGGPLLWPLRISVWGLHCVQIKTAYLPPIPCGLWALLTLWQLTACFFVTVCESLLAATRKWLCIFTYLGQKLMWHLHHPDLASGPWNSLWSLFGLISPQSTNVIIWPILYLDEMKLCPEMPIFSAEYKRYLQNKLRSKQLYYRELNLLNSRPCQDRHSLEWDLLMMTCLSVWGKLFWKRRCF